MASPAPSFPWSLLARDVLSNIVGLLLELMVESVLCCLQELTRWSPLCQHSLLQLLLAMHQPGSASSEPHEISAAGAAVARRPLPPAAVLPLLKLVMGAAASAVKELAQQLLAGHMAAVSQPDGPQGAVEAQLWLGLLPLIDDQE